MEISVIHRVRVYAGMPIGQLTFHTVEGEVHKVYNKKQNAKYVDASESKPQPSRMWRNFKHECLGECGGTYFAHELDEVGCCIVPGGCSVLAPSEK